MLENEPELNSESKRNTLSKNKKFNADIKILQKKFNLDERYSSFIIDYIFVDIFAQKYVDKFTLEKDYDSVTKEPVYYLSLYSDSSLDDIKRSWSEISKITGNSIVKSKRRKPSKNMRRDAIIYKLAKLSFSTQQISDYLKDECGEVVNLTTDQIKIAEFRYRKKHGISQPTKLRDDGNRNPMTPKKKSAANFSIGFVSLNHPKKKNKGVT